MLEDSKILNAVFNSVKNNGLEETIVILSFLVLVSYLFYLVKKSDKDKEEVLQKTEEAVEEFKIKFDECHEERMELKEKIDGYESTVNRLLSSSEAQERLLSNQEKMITKLMNHVIGNKNEDKSSDNR